MHPEPKMLELPATADRLLDLSEQARAQGDVAHAEHLAILAWLAYDRQAPDRDELEGACSKFPPVSSAA